MEKELEPTDEEILDVISGSYTPRITLEQRYLGTENNGFEWELNWNTERRELKPSTRYPFFRVSQYTIVDNENKEKLLPLDIFALENYIPSQSIDYLVAIAIDEFEKSSENLGLVSRSMDHLYRECKKGNKPRRFSITLDSINTQKSPILRPILYAELKAFGSRYEGVKFVAEDIFSGKKLNEYQIQNLGCQLGNLRFLKFNGRSMI